MANHNSETMKKSRRKSVETPICVPKCCQQPRSRSQFGSKRRTDFSLFSNATASLLRCNQTGNLSTSENNKISSITASSMDRRCQALLSRHEEMIASSLVEGNVTQNGERRRIFSDSTSVTSSDSESHHEDTFYNRINVQSRSGEAVVSLCTPNKFTSQITGCSDVQATPGVIMWARTADQTWWPAKILEGRSAPVVASPESVDGHVLVQYYGSREVAWVDPDGNLSEFDECFEERSCNPMKRFQDALEEALHNKEDLDLDSCGQMNRNPDRPRTSSLNEQAVAHSNKWTESSSSKEENDYLERGRGKRNRKPKLHFDEMIFPKRSTKKMRRFRIMRSLGLTAPIGSPFSFASSVTNC